MRWLSAWTVLVMGVIGLACKTPGGTGPSTAGAAPTTHATPASSSSAAIARSSDASCEEACSRLATCTREDASCRTDCESHLASGGRSALYADCLRDLSCEDIQRSMSMNEGPAGRCYSDASRGLPATIECRNTATGHMMRSSASCEAACAKREGSCFFGPECLERCQRDWPTWDNAARKRFVTCAVCNPLCHMQLDQCMSK